MGYLLLSPPAASQEPIYIFFLLQTHVHITLLLVDYVKLCAVLVSGPSRGNGIF